MGKWYTRQVLQIFMLKRWWSIPLFCGLMSVAFLGCFAAWAVYTRDHHHFNRGGALLAAMGALLVVAQVRRELKFERWSIEGEEKIAHLGNSGLDSLRAKSIKSAIADVKRQRLGMVLGIAIVLFTAEIAHGWGDFFLDYFHQANGSH